MASTSRQQLLEAAIVSIDQGGEAALRVDEVAEAAGVTKPTLYHYFGDRDGLVAAAQAERFRRLMMLGLDEALRIVREAASVEEFAAMLPALVAIGAGEEGASRRAARAAVLGSATSRPQLTKEIRDVLVVAGEQLAEFYRIGKERGLITSDIDDDVMSHWWFSVLAGRHLIDVLDDDRITAQWEQMTVWSMQKVLLGD
jgi:AcrR family transcriptional regulator